MVRSLLLRVALCGALAVLVLPEAPASAAHRCPGQTVARRGALRIVAWPLARAPRRIYSCHPGAPRRLLWQPIADEWEPLVRHLTVAGGVFAYELSSWTDASAGATRRQQVVVRSVRDGRRRSATALGLRAVRRLVLAPSGSVAWTDRRAPQYGEDPPTSSDRVIARDARAAGVTVLDQSVALGRGPGEIDLRSLRLDGTVLSWRHLGQRRTATLR